ncbi:MAG: hypothetical protein QOD30_340, partial [Actinomycetota bacterium]|nr:hypothetical protein [Actinomycetota bacterium]
MIDIATRDMDVPLSELGEDQARSLHDRMSALAPAECPTIAISSPYVRAEQTARLALGEDATILLDERLREREFGILDRLTRAGIEQKFPEQ